jgi:hypothetical protein
MTSAMIAKISRFCQMTGSDTVSVKYDGQRINEVEIGHEAGNIAGHIAEYRPERAEYHHRYDFR